MGNKSELVHAILTEINAQKNFFNSSTQIDTIYFGGGTPSVLSKSELGRILDEIFKNFKVSNELEICLEANPDDLNLAYLKDLRALNIHRLSIGIQSFDDGVLKWMNRSHTAKQALNCVRDAADAGFEQLNADLIYGVPGLSSSVWESQVETVLNMPVQHLSAYSLTLEEKTAYANFVKKNKYRAPDDDLSVEHYWILNALIEKFNWEQYEVSNYCKDGYYSKHNTAYWKSNAYLGIGPSAHSYNGHTRFWNVRSNAGYIAGQAKGEICYEMEQLSYWDKVNEYIMTGLRTKWGISLQELKAKFKFNFNDEQIEFIQKLLDEGKISFDGDRYIMSKSGMLFSDAISAELFIDHSSHTSS